MTKQSVPHAGLLPAPSQKIDAIQAIRGIAALSVAFGHAASQVSGSSGVAAGGQTFLVGQYVNPDFAQIGVDLFFIVSGFIMVFTTIGREISALEFLQRRAVRIYPLYWFFCLAALAVHSTRYLPRLEGDFVTFLKSFALYPVLWHNLDIMRPAMVPQGWTLTFEIFFYLVFAATMRLKPVAQLTAIVATFTATTIFAASNPVIHTAEMELLGNPFLFEFALGMLLGLIYWKYRALLSPALTRTVALVAVLMVAGLWSTTAPRLLVMGVPAFLMVAAAVLGRRMESLRYPSWLLAAGDASYSIYLSHGLVLTLADAGYIRLPALRAMPPDLYYAMLLVAISVVGVLTHRWVERPLLALFRKRR